MIGMVRTVQRSDAHMVPHLTPLACLALVMAFVISLKESASASKDLLVKLASGSLAARTAEVRVTKGHASAFQALVERTVMYAHVTMIVRVMGHALQTTSAFAMMVFQDQAVTLRSVPILRSRESSAQITVTATMAPASAQGVTLGRVARRVSAQNLALGMVCA